LHRLIVVWRYAMRGGRAPPAEAYIQGRAPVPGGRSPGAMTPARLVANNRAKPPISRMEIMSLPQPLMTEDVYTRRAGSALNCFTPSVPGGGEGEGARRNFQR
jgi:hypothetical protein